FIIRPTSLKADNTPGNVADFDPNQPYAFTIATFGGGILTNVAGPNSDLFSVDFMNFSNPVITNAGSTYSAIVSGNSLVLKFQPVPEPATALALCAAGAGAVVMARRRRRG